MCERCLLLDKRNGYKLNGQSAAQKPQSIHVLVLAKHMGMRAAFWNAIFTGGVAPPIEVNYLYLSELGNNSCSSLPFTFNF